MAKMIVDGPPQTVVEGKGLEELIASCIKNVARKTNKVLGFRAEHGKGDAYSLNAPLSGKGKHQEIDPILARELILTQIQGGAVLTF